VAFPSMLKAAAGGGGRGMRLVHDAEDLARALPGARREATSAFGDGTLYLEQLIRPAHHVEVQLLGDHQGRLAVLGERDCSVQRRHQKLVEESPSPAVGPDLREALFESARTVASTVLFHNAATVEFLVDDAGNHYFLEMNTRLQVEHGVTELVTGLDLVAWQLMIAAGEGLADDVLDIVPRGHAIQARVYAEDPYSAFSPVGGTVSAWWTPGGPGIRVDAAVQPGAPLATDYDPLLAKILVLASDRPAAVARLRRALDETVIGGLQTDLGFHRWLVDDQAFATGQYDTGLVEDRWGHGPDLSDEDRSKAAFAATQGRLAASAGSGEAPSDSPDERPWTRQARQEALRGDR
jgi:acetyl/propionyl-CoA carboxylase alpha subunit